MQPTVGRNVQVMRTGKIFHANITRVERHRIPEGLGEILPDGISSTAELQFWLSEERHYDVWLAQFVHTSVIADVLFTPGPLPFSPTPAEGCWFWPPRVP